MAFNESRIVRPFYYLSVRLARLLLLLLTQWQVRGREKLPRQGPFLVVSNHLNLVDPPVIMASMHPRRVIFMAKQELFKGPFSWIIRGVGAFSVRRNQLDRQAFRRAEEVLNAGFPVAVFPEGSRSKGSMKAGLPGAAFLAARSGVPLLPVGIQGTERLKGKGWVLRRRRITVIIGDPFLLPAGDGRVKGEDLEFLTDFIMRRIAQLLPPSYQGIYREDSAED
ncbi:MAG: lysophospholipid acyltransferase family protein [Dehalococcoidia bacterium]|nr:lysophospholipid acyltransferase family protein [Dehalococcoidia bacterium]